jgi:hypothetical protein
MGALWCDPGFALLHAVIVSELCTIDVSKVFSAQVQAFNPELQNRIKSKEDSLQRTLTELTM